MVNNDFASYMHWLKIIKTITQSFILYEKVDFAHTEM